MRTIYWNNQTTMRAIYWYSSDNEREPRLRVIRHSGKWREGRDGKVKLILYFCLFCSLLVIYIWVFCKMYFCVLFFCKLYFCVLYYAFFVCVFNSHFRNFLLCVYERGKGSAHLSFLAAKMKSERNLLVLLFIQILNRIINFF